MSQQPYQQLEWPFFPREERLFQPQQPEEPRGERQRKYHIPGRTENPAVNYGTLQRWIRDFHQQNGLQLPKGFYRRDKRQLTGMFYGMLRTYGISIDDIVSRRG